MSKNYDDIINLPHPTSKTRPPMPTSDRAAQFAPFAALSGHEEAVKEAARLTMKKPQLDEQMQEILSRKLQFILEHLKDCHPVSISYFQADSRKQGGEILELSGVVEGINEQSRSLHMRGKTKIALDDIIDIKGRIFPAFL